MNSWEKENVTNGIGVILNSVQFGQKFNLSVTVDKMTLNRIITAMPKRWKDILKSITLQPIKSYTHEAIDLDNTLYKL